MATHKVEDIRNVALVGHGAAGKTTLADAMLFYSKAVDRKGSVDDGSSISDFDDEEKKRKFSIDTSVLHLDAKGKRIHLLDTPGYPDFVGAALCALDAVENAAVVISAPSGIQVNTRRMFREAGKRELARFIVINKLDADNIHFAELLTAIRDTFGKGCVLFNAPNAVGAKFSSVLSVLHPPASAPADCPVDLAAARSELIGAAVESDDALAEKFLMEEPISDEELIAVLPKSLAAGTLVPRGQEGPWRC
jgi:elongation factor G